MIKKVSLDSLRKTLTKFRKECIGEKIYLTSYNEIIGELKFYTDAEKRAIGLEVAKRLVADAEGTETHLFD